MTITIAKFLPLDRFEVKFVIVHRCLGTIVDFIPKNYEIIHIPVHNIYCAATLRMMHVIRHEKPDVVFSSLLYLNSRLIIAAKLCGCKSVVRNNIDLSLAMSKIAPFLVKITYRLADKVIAQQEEMHDEIIAYTGIAKDKVVTLHNPLDVEDIDKKAQIASPFTDEGFQVKYVWVGRFSREKGQDLVVKALQLVIKVIHNAHLYLVGKFDKNSTYVKSILDYVEKQFNKNFFNIIQARENPPRHRIPAPCQCKTIGRGHV